MTVDEGGHRWEGDGQPCFSMALEIWPGAPVGDGQPHLRAHRNLQSSFETTQKKNLTRVPGKHLQFTTEQEAS